MATLADILKRLTIERKSKLTKPTLPSASLTGRLARTAGAAEGIEGEDDDRKEGEVCTVETEAEGFESWRFWRYNYRWVGVGKMRRVLDPKNCLISLTTYRLLLVTVSVGFLLIMWWGVMGAAIGIASGRLFSWILAVALYNKATKKKRNPSACQCITQ